MKYKMMFSPPAFLSSFTWYQVCFSWHKICQARDGAWWSHVLAREFIQHESNNGKFQQSLVARQTPEQVCLNESWPSVCANLILFGLDSIFVFYVQISEDCCLAEPAILTLSSLVSALQLCQVVPFADCRFRLWVSETQVVRSAHETLWICLTHTKFRCACRVQSMYAAHTPNWPQTQKVHIVAEPLGDLCRLEFHGPPGWLIESPVHAQTLEAEPKHQLFTVDHLCQCARWQVG